jgi:serine/threonine protein kinase
LADAEGFTELVFDPKDFEIQNEPLESTSLSTVYQAIGKSDQKLYALKMLKLSDEDAPNGPVAAATRHSRLVWFFREILSQYFCASASILPLTKFGLIDLTPGGPVLPCIVSPWMTGGNLATAVAQQPDVLTPTRRSIIAYGSIFALALIHAHGIHHRDVKPENLLLDDNFESKLADLGLANFKSFRSAQNSGQVGTAMYAVPEVWRSSKYDFRSDVFGWGFILWVLAHLRAVEYPGNDTYNEMIQDGRIQECWAANPDNRPNAAAIVRRFREGSCLFDGTDWPEFVSYVRRVDEDAQVRNHKMMAPPGEQMLGVPLFLALTVDDPLYSDVITSAYAEDDDPASQLLLGVLYECGIAVDKCDFLARRHLERAKSPAAEKVFHVMSNRPPPERFIALSVELELEGKLEEAFNVLRQQVASSIQALTAMGAFLVRHGNQDVGYRALATAARKKDPEALFLYGHRPASARQRHPWPDRAVSGRHSRPPRQSFSPLTLARVLPA